MVQANYRMLRDGLKVARVALVTGVSMGGTQTYVWGVMHPEYRRRDHADRRHHAVGR